MSLFFDGVWFDERLASLGLSRATLATALGLTEAALDEIWKDQREISAREVGIIAALLATTGEEIAAHAGISTPVPRGGTQSLADIVARLDRIESVLERLTALVRGKLRQ